jgi:hypothetical protein
VASLQEAKAQLKSWCASKARITIRMGDRADGCYSRSGLMMEVPAVHDTLRNAKSNALRTTAVPRSGREPLPLIVRFRRGATLLF